MAFHLYHWKIGKFQVIGVEILPPLKLVNLSKHEAPVPQLVRDLVNRLAVAKLVREETVPVVGILDLRDEDGPAHLEFTHGLK